MFLAVGLDLSRDPCPMIVMDRIGKIVEYLNEERSYEGIVSRLELIAVCHGKIVFCALSSSQGEQFLSFSPWLKTMRIHLIAYDDQLIERMEDRIDNHHYGIPLRVYCLAKIAQSEGLDLYRRHEDIRKLYEMREALDRLLIRLSTREAFPDEYLLMHQW